MNDSDGSDEDSKDTIETSPDEDNIVKITVNDLVTLKDMELEIAKGEFVAIIGEIGSGKSSILSSCIGDMLYINDTTMNKYKDHEIFKPKQGKEVEDKESLKDLNNQVYEKFTKTRQEQYSKPVIHISGSMSYVQQTPWILNQTIRNNILLGEELDEDRYNDTIEICQLARDLEILEGGDLTQIGEKGINLSGGQKARVSIARAVYANNDIVLMDDPLSALDAHVRKEIFQQVL